MTVTTHHLETVRTADLASYDTGLLLESLLSLDGDLEGVGYGMDDLEVLANDLAALDLSSEAADTEDKDRAPTTGELLSIADVAFGEPQTQTARPGDPAALLGVQFGDEPADEMIVVGPVAFTSLCEHHLLPFTGHAWVAYIPTDSKVVGLSKLARLVDHYAKRAQVQERMTRQIVEAINEHLTPEGAACVVRSTHACLSLRGASKNGALMTTSALSGILKHDQKARQEFMEFARP